MVLPPNTPHAATYPTGQETRWTGFQLRMALPVVIGLGLGMKLVPEQMASRAGSPDIWVVSQLGGGGCGVWLVRAGGAGGQELGGGRDGVWWVRVGGLGCRMPACSPHSWQAPSQGPALPSALRLEARLGLTPPQFCPGSRITVPRSMNQSCLLAHCFRPVLGAGIPPAAGRERKQ